MLWLLLMLMKLTQIKMQLLLLGGADCSDVAAGSVGVDSADCALLPTDCRQRKVWG
jgi:hypothetical protein